MKGPPNQIFAKLVLLLALSFSRAFIAQPLCPRGPGYRLAAVSTDVDDLESQIDEAISLGHDPKPLIAQLDKIPSSSEPNRSPKFMGEWHVWYTNCPPPSNGQLGPFQGTSGQVIGTDKSYQNLLKVPPNNWLSATLDGIWEEWDGQYLDGASNSEKMDWGASHWKVTFITLQIELLGLTLFRKKFPPDTSRIWRTSFMDDNLRVVHAGQTGRPEDEYVFYTKRTPKP